MRATKYLTAAVLVLASVLSLACAIPAWAAFTVGGDVGEVSPTGPSNWTSSTTGYIGWTSGKTGTLTVDGGSDLLGGNVYLGYFSGTGSVTITGVGSTWTNKGFISVAGEGGTGSLTVQSGAIVSTESLLARPNDLKGNGVINVNALVSDMHLLFDATHGSTQSLTFGTGGVLNLSINGSGELGAGYLGTGSLTVTGGVTVAAFQGELGYYPGSNGTCTVSGVGSAWSNSGTLYVGIYGAGTLNVQTGATVSSSTSFIGFGSNSDSKGAAVVTGSGSRWAVNGYLMIGGGGTGTLRVENGGLVSNTDGYIGSDANSTGSTVVAGAGSIWNNSGILYLGKSGTGYLTIADGARVTAKNLSINSKSTVNLRVSGSGMMTLGTAGAAGTVTNGGKINLYADAFLAAGTYSPITDAGKGITWSGSGTYNATGGTWNADRTFTVLPATVLDARGSDSVSTGERLLISDLASGKRVGASFGAVGAGVNLSADLIGQSDLDLLAPALAADESVRSAWDFTTNFSGGTALLAFEIGTGQSDVKVWQYAGGAWTPFAASDLIYDGHGIASFTVSSVGDYAITAVPEPATLGLLALGGMALIRRRAAGEGLAERTCGGPDRTDPACAGRLRLVTHGRVWLGARWVQASVRGYFLAWEWAAWFPRVARRLTTASLHPWLHSVAPPGR